MNVVIVILNETPYARFPFLILNSTSKVLRSNCFKNFIILVIYQCFLIE